jgi:hypothetical protein
LSGSAELEAAGEFASPVAASVDATATTPIQSPAFRSLDPIFDLRIRRNGQVEALATHLPDSTALRRMEI